MKIAISVTNEKGLESPISKHFGRSPFFAFAEVEGETVKTIEVLANPFVKGHLHGQVPEFIHKQGVDVMLSGGMGQGAIGHFEKHGIETATGAEGTVRQALEDYFKGELSEVAPCGDHDGHQHGQGIGRGHGLKAGQGK